MSDRQALRERIVAALHKLPADDVKWDRGHKASVRSLLTHAATALEEAQGARHEPTWEAPITLVACELPQAKGLWMDERGNCYRLEEAQGVPHAQGILDQVEREGWLVAITPPDDGRYRSGWQAAVTAARLAFDAAPAAPTREPTTDEIVKATGICMGCETLGPECPKHGAAPTRDEQDARRLLQELVLEWWSAPGLEISDKFVRLMNESRAALAEPKR